nr:type III pantothenate kinase [Oceanospirillum sediminis]
MLVDIGNTRIKYARNSDGNHLDVRVAGSLSDIPLNGVREIRVAAVARAEEARNWEESVPSGVRFKRAVVKPEWHGLTCAYEDCSRLGVDRWLALLAGRKEIGGNLMLVSLGSAITVDYLTGEGVHEGGYILPGLTMMRQSLGQTTAQVGFAEGQNQNICPGKNTEQCVDHGVLCITRDFLQQRIACLRGKDYSVWLSGGDARLISAQITEKHEIAESLVLRGLRHCFDM